MDDKYNSAREDAAKDKTKGRVNETIGKVKDKIGSVTGDRDLQVKGQAQTAEGKKDRLKGEIKDKVEDAKDYVKAGVDVVKDKMSRDKSRH